SSLHPLLFLPPHRLHLDLPSFPTRRSSDLRSTAPRSVPGRGATAKSARAITSSARSQVGRLRAASAPRMRVISTSSPKVASVSRSEEHTSELQSRENLVCRLLLEKKNNKRN